MELSKFAEKYGKRANGKPWAGANGVYVISPACPTKFWEGEKCGKEGPKSVKIGRSSGESGFAGDKKGRLSSYKTYWPNGVTVHAVLITPSFDKRYHTFKDVALQRETTLRRIFKKKRLTGFGGIPFDKKKGHLGKEWINLSPSKIMNHLIAAGPLRNKSDRLYKCTESSCDKVDISKLSRNTTQLNDIVKELEYVLEDEIKQKKVGIRGRPVVLPRSIVIAAKKRSHPLHIYSHLLKSNIDEEQRESLRRLANKKTHDVKELSNKKKQVRTRLEKKKINEKVIKIRKKEHRNLAAIRPSKGYVVKSTKKVPSNTRGKRGEIVGEDINTIKGPHHPLHRARYDNAKKATARMQFKQRLNENGSKESDSNESDSNESDSNKNDSNEKSWKSCPRPSRRNMTQIYTFYNVAGDNRCYFYAIMKALGLPLSKGLGNIKNINRGLGLIDSNKKAHWEKEIGNGKWRDPISVLENSKQMCKILYDKGIRYIAKLSRKRKNFSELEAYLADPTTTLLDNNENDLYLLRAKGEIMRVKETTKRIRRPASKASFEKAFEDGRVITLIWRNVRGEPHHYEVIMSKYL